MLKPYKYLYSQFMCMAIIIANVWGWMIKVLRFLYTGYYKQEKCVHVMLCKFCAWVGFKNILWTPVGTNKTTVTE